MEHLDPWASRAFADHQIAHVYVRHPADESRTGEVLDRRPGIAEVLTGEARPRRRR